VAGLVAAFVLYLVLSPRASTTPAVTVATTN
jgi:hypothetical protein